MILLEKKSVIIPFYSNKEWLDQALCTVVNQTMPVDEIIVVNDGSPEDIDDIKKKYESKVVFLYQENKGAGFARNLGIKKSSGDILFFLDSDDLWDKRKVEKQLTFMKNNNYKWCATSYKTFGVGKSKVVTPYMTKKICWQHLYNSSLIATPTVAIYKKHIDKYGAFAPDMKKGQDIFLWFKLSNHLPLGVLCEPLTFVRMRNGSTMNSLAAHIQMRAKLWEKMHITKELYMPKHILTKLGYMICYKIFDLKGNYCLFDKIAFAFAWGLFRIDNLLFTR